MAVYRQQCSRRSGPTNGSNFSFYHRVLPRKKVKLANYCGIYVGLFTSSESSEERTWRRARHTYHFLRHEAFGFQLSTGFVRRTRICNRYFSWALPPPMQIFYAFWSFFGPNRTHLENLDIFLIQVHMWIRYSNRKWRLVSVDGHGRDGEANIRKEKIYSPSFTNNYLIVSCLISKGIS